ncbi:glycoside hydrolase family 43 protein [Segetibacter sp.]|jgi:GH43 family beta-xylosidase|uniref:glycoside hydrolase family 43 protein n=1 Tax=Segetibacter sp. TaxID=2231182 RepID=UPI002601827F|nr:glycoside hydrolase family 43 protein [Segetibacter sp.]
MIIASKRNYSTNLSIAFMALMLASCSVFKATQSSHETFTNPLLPRGADPWNIYKDGYYYYTQTMGNRIEIWKTKNISELNTAPHKTVWTPPPGTAWSKNLWAPEIHFIDNKWYVYFAADNGRNVNHRLYVIENSSKDPLEGEWTFKGKISDSTDRWAIDGSVFEYKKQWYMTWAGWEAHKNGSQDIYIAKMSNPWTIDGKRFRISAPTFDWEKYGDLIADSASDNPAHVDVNEGPEILKHKDKLFLVYSASACWTDYYGLGMLTFTGKGDNLLDSASWVKSPASVFKQSSLNSVYAPGHNSFFKSPNGKEDWILYHANRAPNMGCGGNRSPRAQKFTWKKDGTPDFGEPVKEGVPIRAPQ